MNNSNNDQNKFVSDDKFIQDLEFGELWEARLIPRVDNFSYEFPEVKDRSKWDIKFYVNPDEVLRIEVKADRMMHKTNNIAIEFMCNDKPSGIDISKALVWAIWEVIPDKKPSLYMIPRQILRLAIKDGKYKRIVKGGDLGRSSMFLFDKSVFKDYLLGEREIYTMERYKRDSKLFNLYK